MIFTIFVCCLIIGAIISGYNWNAKWQYDRDASFIWQLIFISMISIIGLIVLFLGLRDLFNIAAAMFGHFFNFINSIVYDSHWYSRLYWFR
jgi:hypothetical protein